MAFCSYNFQIIQVGHNTKMQAIAFMPWVLAALVYTYRATSWSYGWEELPNLMIPNFNGGASAGAVNPEKSATIKLLRQAGQKKLKETAKALPLYWGPQPFTAGPMYMGAITVFLFILGLVCYKGRKSGGCWRPPSWPS